MRTRLPLKISRFREGGGLRVECAQGQRRWLRAALDVRRGCKCQHTHTRSCFLRRGPIARIRPADLAGAALRRRRRRRAPRTTASKQIERAPTFISNTEFPYWLLLPCHAMQARISLTGLQQNRRLLPDAARFLRSLSYTESSIEIYCPLITRYQ